MKQLLGWGGRVRQSRGRGVKGEEGLSEKGRPGSAQVPAPKACKGSGTQLQIRAPGAIQWLLWRLQEKSRREKKPHGRQSWPAPGRRPHLCLSATPSLKSLLQSDPRFSHCDLGQTTLPSRPGFPAAKQRVWTGTFAHLTLRSR